MRIRGPLVEVIKDIAKEREMTATDVVNELIEERLEDLDALIGDEEESPSSENDEEEEDATTEEDEEGEAPSSENDEDKE